MLLSYLYICICIFFYSYIFEVTYLKLAYLSHSLSLFLSLSVYLSISVCIYIYIYIYIYICIRFYIYTYIYIHTSIYTFWSVKPLYKECSMKALYNTTSKVFKQRKQLIWNLQFHAGTAAIFSQMNNTLNLQYHGIFCII